MNKNNNGINDSMDADSLAESLARAERIKTIKNALRNREQAENMEFSQLDRDIQQPKQVHFVNKSEYERNPVSHVREIQIPDTEIQFEREPARNPVKRPVNNKSCGKKKKRKKKKNLVQKFRGLFPEKGDGTLESIRKVVFLASVVAIIVCGYMVGDYYLDLWRNNMQNKEIEEIYDIYNPEYIPKVEEPEENAPEKYYEKLISAQKLLDINPEIIGFMTIPTIDGEPIVKLPVMQTTDNSKYLNINAKGNESRAGALFLDYRNNFDRVENHHLAVKNSDNLVVYGHNMADESMFGSLKYYYRNYDYYDKHPIIYFSSNYENYAYKIFAFFMLDAEDNTETKFDCWNKFDFENEEDFYNFVNEAKRRTIRTNDIDVEYGDQLLTVSTCNSDLFDD
nr:class B sortase [Ruminococcus sp.]